MPLAGTDPLPVDLQPVLVVVLNRAIQRQFRQRTLDYARRLLSPKPYAVTKHAAVSFAEWLAITYGDRGLRVSCLCPQFVRTEMLAEALEKVGTTATPYLRASFRAASFASAPELQKNTRSANECSTSTG
mgnify:CR=1 FL=1